MRRIYVDFNTMEEDDRVFIAGIGRQSPRDVELVNVLRDGEHVLLYDEDMEIEAIVEFDVEHSRWMGVPDWATLRHYD